MLFGGRAAFFPESSKHHPPQRGNPPPAHGHRLPQLRDTQIEYVWGGTLDFAFDIMPTPANSTASTTP